MIPLNDNKRGDTKLILVIEDEKHIAEGLKLNLKLKGFAVEVAFNGSTGLQKWQECHPDLIVLDIMMPGIDGFSVLRNIRLADGRIPILILSAKGEPEDRIKGFTYGVDDYLSKPFNLDEFLLRVDRLLKRSSWDKNDQYNTFNDETLTVGVYSFGDNQIQFDSKKAICQKGHIHLTEQEIRLLKLFISNSGSPLTRKLLLEIGWGYTQKTSTRTIDNFIVRLRKYFEIDPKNPKYFKSIRSVGYIFLPEG